MSVLEVALLLRSWGEQVLPSSNNATTDYSLGYPQRDVFTGARTAVWGRAALALVTALIAALAAALDATLGVALLKRGRSRSRFRSKQVLASSNNATTNHSLSHAQRKVFAGAGAAVRGRTTRALVAVTALDAALNAASRITLLRRSNNGFRSKQVLGASNNATGDHSLSHASREVLCRIATTSRRGTGGPTTRLRLGLGFPTTSTPRVALLTSRSSFRGQRRGRSKEVFSHGDDTTGGHSLSHASREVLCRIAAAASRRGTGVTTTRLSLGLGFPTTSSTPRVALLRSRSSFRGRSKEVFTHGDDTTGGHPLSHASREVPCRIAAAASLRGAAVTVRL
jgi:hypothetical protein